MKKSRNRNLKLIIAIIHFLLGVLVIIMLFFTAGLFLSRKNDLWKSRVKQENIYKYYRFDPSKNKSSVGFTKIFDNLDGDKFISYQKSNSEYVLISNFGTREYKCYGKCICEGRRRASLAAYRNLFYLVAAVSGMVAYNIAKESFENQCLEIMEDSCRDEIKSEIDRCESTTADTDTYVDNSEIYENMKYYYGMMDDAKESEIKFPQTFECYGHCLPYRNEVQVKQGGEADAFSLQFVKIYDAMEREAIGFSCENLELKKSIVVKSADDVNELGPEIIVEKVKKGLKEKVELEFKTGPLHEFCLSQSKTKIDAGLKKKVRESVCVGCFTYSDEPYENESVQCIEKPE